MQINGLGVLWRIEHKYSVLYGTLKATGDSRAQCLKYDFIFLIWCYLVLKCSGTMVVLFFTDLQWF